MAIWVPFFIAELRGEEISAPDRREATRIARQVYGDDFVRVQSRISMEIAEEELRTIERERQRRDDAA